MFKETEIKETGLYCLVEGGCQPLCKLLMLTFITWRTWADVYGIILSRTLQQAIICRIERSDMLKKLCLFSLYCIWVH